MTAAAVAAILVGSACASAGSGPRDPGASQAPAAVHCPTTPVMPGRTNESIPAGFKTAWVLRCRDDERAVPGDGTWHFRIEERADTNAAALVVALQARQEDAERDCVPGHRYQPWIFRTGR